MDFSQFDYTPLALAFVQVVWGVLVLILAKFALGWLSPYATDQELTARDNPAFGLAIAGYYAGTVIIYVSATASLPLPLDEGAQAVFTAMAGDLAWSLAGIAALNAGRWIMDRSLVIRVRNDLEIIEHRNLAAGVLECGAYIAYAIVLAGAIRQPGGTPWTAIGLLVLGQGALIVAGRLYQKWVGYDVAKEIQSANLAAGTAFAMTLIALAILMLKAISGEFISWTRNLSFFAFDAIAGLILLMLLRWITGIALLPRSRPTEEIVRDRNVNVGLIEGVLAIGIAVIILFLF